MSGLFSHLKRLIVLVSLCAVSALTSPAQDIDLPYQKFVLPNGLTVLVHEDHKAPVVAIDIWYHVGSKDELPGKTGFAHLFEHLMFGGSANVKGSYIEAMEGIGATTLNGTTNVDRTNFFETVPVSALDYALFAESDRMGHLDVSQHTLDLQRGVVQNEKRQDENQPYAVAEELTAKNTYPAAHPYSHTTIGSMADLNAASLSDVQKWFKTYYGPSNATLVLAGDITLPKAKELVTKYFGDIPPGPPVAHEDVWVAKMSGTHVEHVQDRVPQPQVSSTWNVPEYGSADADYLDLVSDVLSTGKDSRLYKRLVYDSQVATSVNAYIDENEIGSQFEIDVMAKPGSDLSKIQQVVQEELNRFIASGPTPEELERVKTYYEANLIRSLDPAIAQANLLARGQVFVGNPDQYKVSLERVRSATAQDLQSVARRWLSDGVYQLTILPYPSYKAVPPDVARSTPPAIGSTPALKMPKFQRATLSNGLKVILVERHELPLVNFAMLINAGYSADHLATPGTASMTSSQLTGGTDKYSALQISDQLQRLGAELRSSAGIDESVVTMSALRRNLDPSLALFADVLLHPSFPQQDFLRQQKLQIAQIQQEKSIPIYEAIRILPPLLYGPDHPYGAPLTGSGTEASVSKMTREDLVKFHSTWFKPNNATLIVVGDTTLAQIQPELEKALASWKPGAVPEKQIPKVTEPKQASVYIVNKPGALQSTIIVGTIAPPRSSSDEIALKVWNDILSGTFSGRLNMDIRENKHWSYGVESLYIGAREQRPFVILAPVQTDKTKDALAELDLDLKNYMGDHPPTQAELKGAQDYETRGLAGSLETIGDVQQAVRATVNYKLPDDYYTTFGSKVLALNPTDLDQAGKSFFDPNHLVWVIVGDQSKIEAGIRSLNLGSVHFIDADGKSTQ
ncbi:MAG TPA: pitrilysin family protein [Acidobacteriaceae bacterium]|nr:pitrilysin family protein [Acidobacteriaceae bacterium]